MSTVSVPLDQATPLWERFFTVAPLGIVGTLEGDGYDLAPKHMIVPLGRGNYIGFVCTPDHATYRNVRQHGAFTLSFVKPSQLVVASLAASRRVNPEGDKPGLLGLPVEPAKKIEGVLVKDSYVQLECRLAKVVEGFDDNSLIAGRIVAAHVDEHALRVSDADESEAFHESPMLAYVHPGRFAEITETYAFPHPASDYD